MIAAVFLIGAVFFMGYLAVYVLGALLALVFWAVVGLFKVLGSVLRRLTA